MFAAKMFEDETHRLVLTESSGVNMQTKRSVRSGMGLLLMLCGTWANAQTYRLSQIAQVPMEAYGETAAIFGPDFKYDYTSTRPAMNNIGDLVWGRVGQDDAQIKYEGSVFTSSRNWDRAAIYRGTQYVKDIPPFVHGANYATAINDKGAVIGYSFGPSTFLYPSSGTAHDNGGYKSYSGYVFENGHLTDLNLAVKPNLSPWYATVAQPAAINNNGAIVGAIGTFIEKNGYAEPEYAFIYQNGQLQTLTSSTPSRAYDVNDKGQVVGTVRRLNVGSSDNPDRLPYFGDDLPFLYENGQLTMLSDKAGSAIAVNNHGVAVGVSENRGALFKDGQTFFLGGAGILGRAEDINDSGVVVGSEGLYSSDRAFIYRDGQYRYLDSLLEHSYQGWLITDAYQINNAGDILVSAINPTTQKQEYALLTAVPEPEALAMLLAGLVVVVPLARKSRKPRRSLASDPVWQVRSAHGNQRAPTHR